MGSVCGKVSNPRHVFPYSKAKEQPGQAAGIGHGSLRDPEDFVFMQRDGPDDPLILLALKKKNTMPQNNPMDFIMIPPGIRIPPWACSSATAHLCEAVLWREVDVKCCCCCCCWAVWLSYTSAPKYK